MQLSTYYFMIMNAFCNLNSQISKNLVIILKLLVKKKRAIIIIGSDHGCGTSCFLIRTNDLNSKSRREVNKADYGTCTTQFAKVD